MKKVIFILAVIFLTACSSEKTNECCQEKIDSTSVSTDSTSVSTDTMSVELVKDSIK